MVIRSRFTRLIVPVFALVVASAVFARSARDHNNVGKDGIGIKGFDPVAYFDGAPTPGDPALIAQHNGVTYRFATVAHRDRFVAEPQRYTPAYGGWCATAFAEDHGKVDIDPRSFKVTDGKLYLFYRGWLGDARKAWIKNEPGNIVKADRNWNRLASE